MTDERLLEYLRNNLEMGYSVQYLTEMLIQKGWEIDEIKNAISIIQGNPPAEEEPPKFQPPGPPQPQEKPSQAPDGAQTAAQAKPEKAKRPLGVTVICILVFFGALLMLLAGVLMIFMQGLFGDMGMLLSEDQFSMFLGNQTGTLDFVEIGSLFGFLGPIFIVLAIVEFVGFFLMWKMKKMGWIIIAIAGIATIVLYMLSFSGINYVFYIALTAVVIAYLMIKRKLFT